MKFWLKLAFLGVVSAALVWVSPHLAGTLQWQDVTYEDVNRAPFRPDVFEQEGEALDRTLLELIRQGQAEEHEHD